MKRYHVRGHVYYITTNTYNRLSLFICSAFVLPLLDSLNFYRHQYNFALLGYVIMRDHLHLLLWPRDEPSISAFMRDFKTFTAKRIINQAEAEGRQEWLLKFREAGEATHRGANKVWQDSYWDKNIFSERFLRQKLNYMHRNPLRAGLVTEPAAYPYSSYRNYVMGDESLIEIDRGWS